MAEVKTDITIRFQKLINNACEFLVFLLSAINIIANTVFLAFAVYPFLKWKDENPEVPEELYIWPDWLSVFNEIGIGFFNVSLLPLLIFWALSYKFKDLGKYSVRCLLAISLINNIYSNFSLTPDWYFLVMGVLIFIIFVVVSIRYVLINR